MTHMGRAVLPDRNFDTYGAKNKNDTYGTDISDKTTQLLNIAAQERKLYIFCKK